MCNRQTHQAIWNIESGKVAECMCVEKDRNPRMQLSQWAFLWVSFRLFDPQTGFSMRHKHTQRAVFVSCFSSAVLANAARYTGGDQQRLCFRFNVLQTMLWILVIFVTLPKEDAFNIPFKCVFNRIEYALIGQIKTSDDSKIYERLNSRIYWIKQNRMNHNHKKTNNRQIHKNKVTVKTA